MLLPLCLHPHVPHAPRRSCAAPGSLARAPLLLPPARPAAQVRRVLDQIRGRSYEEAIMILEYMPYKVRAAQRGSCWLVPMPCMRACGAARRCVLPLAGAPVRVRCSAQRGQPCRTAQAVQQGGQLVGCRRSVAMRPKRSGSRAVARRGARLAAGQHAMPQGTAHGSTSSGRRSMPRKACCPAHAVAMAG